MGLVGQYVDSIKSNFSNAVTSFSKVADKPSDGSILGRIFGGLKNLGDAAIHATAGLAKIALPIAAGVALVSLGPVGWIGLGALALTLLGGDPKKPEVNTPGADQAKDGAPPPPPADTAKPADDTPAPAPAKPEVVRKPIPAAKALELAKANLEKAKQEIETTKELKDEDPKKIAAKKLLTDAEAKLKELKEAAAAKPAVDTNAAKPETDPVKKSAALILSIMNTPNPTDAQKKESSDTFTALSETQKQEVLALVEKSSPTPPTPPVKP